MTAIHDSNKNVIFDLCVMTICTELIKANQGLVPLIEQWNAMAPMGRLGAPEELESICVYLAGGTSSFTTGSDFVIDGAFTCF